MSKKPPQKRFSIVRATDPEELSFKIGDEASYEVHMHFFMGHLKMLIRQDFIPLMLSMIASGLSLTPLPAVLLVKRRAGEWVLHDAGCSHAEEVIKNAVYAELGVMLFW